MLGVDGIAEFNALHSRKHNHEVQLYAFDILALDGEDRRLHRYLQQLGQAREAAQLGLLHA